MKIYTKEDLNNLQSGDKETVLKAEKTFITFGEGLSVTAIRLDEVIASIPVKKEKKLGAVKKEKKGKK